MGERAVQEGSEEEVKNKTRGQISVRGTTHAKLKAGAEAQRKSMSQIVEEGINRYLDGQAQAVDSPPREG